MKFLNRGLMNQAERIEKLMRQVTGEELSGLGATKNPSAVWTFRDGSKGRMLARPIAVYSDARQTERIGSAYFEAI